MAHAYNASGDAWLSSNLLLISPVPLLWAPCVSDFLKFKVMFIAFASLGRGSFSL